MVLEVFSKPSYSLNFHHDKKYVKAIFVGPLTFDFLKSAFSAIMNHPEYKPGMNRFFDLRECDMSQMSSDDWGAYGQFVKSLETTPGKVKAVALVARDLEYGMIRLFQSVSDFVLPSETFVTKDSQEAERWILS